MHMHMHMHMHMCMYVMYVHVGGAARSHCPLTSRRLGRRLIAAVRPPVVRS
jgi:hypothetical protein